MKQPGSVLITGAATGIGRATALRLDRLGWKVFAGVRSEGGSFRAGSEALGPRAPTNLMSKRRRPLNRGAPGQTP